MHFEQQLKRDKNKMTRHRSKLASIICTCKHTYQIHVFNRFSTCKDTSKYIGAKKGTCFSTVVVACKADNFTLYLTVI